MHVDLPVTTAIDYYNQISKETSRTIRAHIRLIAKTVQCINQIVEGN